MYSILDNIKNIAPYIPGKPIKEVERELGIKDSIKLASNENPWGFSKNVRKIIEQGIDTLNIYPDGNSFYLKQRIAEEHKVNVNNVIVGNGSNEVIDIIMRAMLTHGYSVVTSKYSFVIYRLIAKSMNAEAILTPDKNLAYDPDTIIKACTDKTAIIAIDNPNNPTGTYIPYKDMLRIADFAEKNKILFIVDEAYVHFARAKDYGTMMDVFAKYNNLVISRTFSKVYGLSGLRAGYAIAHEWVLDLANRVRQPFNVNSLAQEACIAALDDNDFVNEVVKKNSEAADYFYREFDKMGIKYIPSQCNFILIEVPVNCKEFFEQLLRLGIIVRPMGNYGLEKYIRISIGTMEQNKKAIEAIKNVIKFESTDHAGAELW